MRIIYSILLLSLLSCKDNNLPVIGFREVVDGHTQFARIPEFNYKNQFDTTIDTFYLKDKIHIANFFFTSCPTICPKTMKSMVRIAQHFGQRSDVAYLCYSIDYKKDSVPRLLEYYKKLNIDNPHFHLLHMPSKAELKRVPERYMSIAMEDESAAGGFDHSGWLLLVDKNRNIRSYCLGTDEKEVERFIGDIENLLDD